MNQTQEQLFLLGRERALLFCSTNGMPPPHIMLVPRHKWRLNACGYYSGHTIRVCIEHCARPCAQVGNAKNWNWPGSTIDREPFGVVCHEMGHYLDDISGRGFSSRTRAEAKEDKLTNYCPNSAEWFAEMCRLFLTNAALLLLVRPRTHQLLSSYWQPVSSMDWEVELNHLDPVPARVVASQKKKFAFS